jgi:hypothetical protein
VNSDCTLKVCDFGLARESDVSMSTALTEYVVTRWYRAPEVLLSGGKYSASIDVWAVGCILAELLLRRPLFPGENYLHQLQLIIQTLGSPTEKELEFVTNPNARAFIVRQPFSAGVAIPSLFPHVRGPCLDLLEQMLVFDPNKRISVDDAIAHPFLARVRSARKGVSELPRPAKFQIRPDLNKLSVAEIRMLFLTDLCGTASDAPPASALPDRAAPPVRSPPADPKGRSVPPMKDGMFVRGKDEPEGGSEGDASDDGVSDDEDSFEDAQGMGEAPSKGEGAPRESHYLNDLEEEEEGYWAASATESSAVSDEAVRPSVGSTPDSEWSAAPHNSMGTAADSVLTHPSVSARKASVSVRPEEVESFISPAGGAPSHSPLDHSVKPRMRPAPDEADYAPVGAVHDSAADLDDRLFAKARDEAAPRAVPAARGADPAVVPARPLPRTGAATLASDTPPRANDQPRRARSSLETAGHTVTRSTDE